MEFKTPKSKKLPSFFQGINLPCAETPVTGIFNGFHVIISDPQSMNMIYNNGNFGKGNLSRSQPCYNDRKDDIPRVIWNSQFEIESNCIPQTAFLVKSKSPDWDCDLQLAKISITNFFEYALAPKSSKPLDSWEKIKRKEENSCPNLRSVKSSDSKILWNGTENDTLDKNFSCLVNGILERRQMKEMKISYKNIDDKVIVVDYNSDNVSDNISLNNISAKLETRPFPVVENLTLNLEESFFLSFALKCLKILDSNQKEMSLEEIWVKFCTIEKNFFERYIIYHYYRTKGWIVQSGLKYGGDYLLYKNGPAYNHASYVVKILHADKIYSWKEFLAINRLVETFNKDILFCRVMQKSSSLNKELTISLEQLANYQVLEVMSRRGLPSTNEVFKKFDDSMKQ